MPLKVPGEEEMEETIASQVAAKEISTDSAVEAVFNQMTFPR